MLAPMLAAELTRWSEQYLSDDFALEEKLDGHRLLLEWHPDTGILNTYNRQGKPSQHADKIQQWAPSFSFIYNYAILDGEYIDGVFHLFDIPLIEGVVDQMHAWEQRQEAVRIMRIAPSDFRQHVQVVPAAVTEDDKLALIMRVTEDGGEGLMIKDRQAPYLHGARTDAYMKLKFVKTVDCVVIDMRTEGKNNATLGVYDGGDEPVEIGRCSLNGKEPVTIGDVIEVRYLYVGANGRLYQPRMLGVRLDKDPKECTREQL